MFDVSQQNNNGISSELYSSQQDYNNDKVCKTSASVRVEGGTASLSKSLKNKSRGNDDRGEPNDDGKEEENENIESSGIPSREKRLAEKLTIAEGGLEDGYDTSWKEKHKDCSYEFKKMLGLSSTNNVGTSFAVCVAICKFVKIM